MHVILKQLEIIITQLIIYVFREFTKKPDWDNSFQWYLTSCRPTHCIFTINNHCMQIGKSACGWGESESVPRDIEYRIT